MNSKSVSFLKLVKEVDEILSKMHSKSSDGEPIQPGSDHWNDTRDRLMKIHVGGETRFMTYPMNWSLSEHLMVDELNSRPDVHPMHVKLKTEL